MTDTKDDFLMASLLLLGIARGKVETVDITTERASRIFSGLEEGSIIVLVKPGSGNGGNVFKIVTKEQEH